MPAKYSPGQLVELTGNVYEPILQYWRDSEGYVYVLNNAERTEIREENIVQEVAYGEYIPFEPVSVVLDGKMLGVVLDCLTMLQENAEEAYGENRCGDCEQELSPHTGDGHTLDCSTPARLEAIKRVKRTLKQYCPEVAATFGL